MVQVILMPEDWDILDKYIEDMLVAVKNDEISISSAKSYLSQYIYEVSYTQLEDVIQNIKIRADEARKHGWSKSH
jgi:hypothetical protein